MSIPNDMIQTLVDLDSYTETHGTGSTDAIICPHCGDHVLAKPPPTGSIPTARLTCRACGDFFALKVVDSPAGRAWLTQTTGIHPVDIAVACAKRGQRMAAITIRDLLDKNWRLQRMVRNLGRLIRYRNEEFTRVSGLAICAKCGLPFFDHPQVDGCELHVSCDGEFLKL